jgi:two-component system OmpR family sensor kinase
MLIKSLRLRLSLLYALIITSLISGLIFFLYKDYETSLYKSIDENLIKEAKILPMEKENKEITNDNIEIIKIIDEKLYKISNVNGIFIINNLDDSYFRWKLNRDLMNTTFKQGTISFETLNHKGENYRLLYYPLKEKGIMRIGISLYDTEFKLSQIKNLGKIFFPALFLISTIIALFFSWQAVNPFIQVKTLVENILSKGVEEKINFRARGREVDDLVSVLNKLLQNLVNLMNSYKNFISEVSHELRSPLTALRGNIEVALRKKRGVDEYEKVLQNNLANTIRLSKIIDNLLFLSKADNNMLELRMEYFDLSNLLRNIVEQKRDLAFSARLNIVEEYAEHVETFGDMDLLMQALSNIIDNAIKYTNPDGIITIKTNIMDNSAAITISDTGTGIPKEEISHIFDRFYRSQKNRSPKQGIGLGLHIAKSIIDAHNGKILVKSQPNRGTEFTILLPKIKKN